MPPIPQKAKVKQSQVEVVQASGSPTSKSRMQVRRQPASAKEVGLVWVSQPVRVFAKADGKEQWLTVQGRRTGVVAVHPRVKADGPGWSVTSVKTGLSVCMVELENDALKIGAVVAVHCHEALDHDDKDEQVKAFPAWARLWLRACTKAGAWVETTPYEVHR